MNIIEVDPYYYSLFENCEYFAVYDSNCGRYNISIVNEHEYHEIIYIGYDVDTNLLVLVYYNSDMGIDY